MLPIAQRTVVGIISNLDCAKSQAPLLDCKDDASLHYWNRVRTLAVLMILTMLACISRTKGFELAMLICAGLGDTLCTCNQVGVVGFAAEGI